MITVSVKSSSRNIDALMRHLPGAADEAARETAFLIQRDAQLEAPADTGALRASIFTVTSLADPGPVAMATAAKLRGSSSVVAKVNYKRPARGEARVVVGVNYGQYVNYGTSRMAARPFMTRAAWRNRKEFKKRIRQKLARSKFAGMIQL